MTSRNRCRPRLQTLEGRDVPAVMTVSFSPVTHTLTVIGSDGANELTVRADAADATHFLLSSITDTFADGGNSLASPSGVHSIAVRMLAGNDTVTLANGPHIRLAGNLTIDGGDGANVVTATDLTVGKNLSVRNGTNSAGSDATTLVNLNVGGGLTVANGNGDGSTNVRRDSAGVSTVRGPVRVSSGTGYDNIVLSDLHVGGDIDIRNGLPNANGFSGFTDCFNFHNTTARSLVKGSISVIHRGGPWARAATSTTWKSAETSS